jgi:hypothetical protein
MIEVSDAQAAPMKPMSRFSPVSTGAVAVTTASVLLAILDPFPVMPLGAVVTRVSDRALSR